MIFYAGNGSFCKFSILHTYIFVLDLALACDPLEYAIISTDQYTSCELYILFINTPHVRGKRL